MPQSNARRLKREHFAFLPNMVTLFNLFSGFLAISLASKGVFDKACWLIVLALVWDSLDGNIARMFTNPSALGKELDSLADLVSFIVAPAFMLSKLLLVYFTPWLMFIFFVYLGAGAYRLARFNVRPSTKGYFEGLPTPAAALTIVSIILSSLKYGWTAYGYFGPVSICVIFALGILMISKIRYPKFSSMPFSRWQSLFYLYLTVFFCGLMTQHLEAALTAGFFIYVLFSPVYSLPHQVVPEAEIH